MEIHHCIHCGTETQPNWRFCRRCGTALENLAAQPAVAHCSNCDSPVAAEWRFCFNCGTGTEDANAVGGSGLTSDDVADLIATPPEATMTAASPEAPAVAEPTHPTDRVEPERVEPQPVEPAAIEPEPVDPAAAEPRPQPERVAPAPFEPRAVEPEPIQPAPFEPEPAPIEPEPIEPEPVAPEAPIDPEPVITGMNVTFEANPDLASEVVTEDSSEAAPSSPPDLAPPLTEVATEPPAPPRADSIEPTQLASERAVAEPPPAPPALDRPATAPEAAEPEHRVADVASAAQMDSEPAIHLPERDTDRTVRTEIPKPIGAARNPLDTQLPQPLGQDAQAPPEMEQPTTETEQPAKRRVAVPEHRPRPEPKSADHLPPIDGRSFQDPGLVGQLVQLALIAAAAISVAMMVGLILLNNRLDAYATSGEGLNRIELAESLINTWLRPLLALAVLGAYVFLVLWARRVTRNLSFFDRAVPETALWMWLIPVVNVFLLYRHLDLAWKGSDVLRRSNEWRKGRPEVWNLGFAVLVVLGFGLIIYGVLLGDDTFETAIDANAFSMTGYALVAASLLCASKAVGTVVGRQRARADSFA